MLLKKSLISKPTTIYISVMAVGYLFDIAVFSSLIFIELDSIIAYIISFLFGTIVNVVLLRKYFMAAKFRILTDVLLTLAANSTVMLIGLGVFTISSYILGINVILSKILSNMLTFTVNYYTRKVYF